MKPSTLDSGQDSDEFLTDRDERYAVDEVCKRIMQDWASSDEPHDWPDLVRTLNAGAARAVKAVRALKKSSA